MVAWLALISAEHEAVLKNAAGYARIERSQEDVSLGGQYLDNLNERRRISPS